VLAGQPVGGVDLAVTARAEGGVVGAAEDARLRRLAGAAQHLHEKRRRRCPQRRATRFSLCPGHAPTRREGRSAWAGLGIECQVCPNGWLCGGLWTVVSGMGGCRCGIMEARGVGRNGNGMDSWRGRGGGDEGGDVAGSCSTRRSRPDGRTNTTAIKIVTFIRSCSQTSDQYQRR
jgi:hypothetical protein